MKIGKLKIDFKKKYPDCIFPKIDTNTMEYRKLEDQSNCKICNILKNASVDCSCIRCGHCFSYKASKEDVDLYIKQIYENREKK